MKNFKLFLLILCFAVSLSFVNMGDTSAASKLYVNGATGNNSYDGSSPVFVSGLIGPKKTIQNAINSLNSSGTIYVAEGTYREHLDINNKTVNLIGKNQKKTIIDGKKQFRPLTINQTASVTITSFTIQNGKAGYGGGIKNYGVLSIKNCIIQKNTANHGGGGIASYKKLTITSSVIQSNTAAEMGGGICLLYGSMNVKNCVIQYNKAKKYQGGGIESAGQSSISNSIIKFNTAKNVGGGIDNFGDMTLTSCKILSNKAGYNGGGIENEGTLTIRKSTIQKNKATFIGGGINSHGTLKIIKSSVRYNSARHGKNTHRW